MSKSFTIPEATFVIANDDDTIIGEMHALFVKKEGCMFVPDGSLQKNLSTEELEDLQKEILKKL